MSRKHNKYGYIPNQNYNFNSPLPMDRMVVGNPQTFQIELSEKMFNQQVILKQLDITDDFEINFNGSGSELSGRFMIAVRRSTGELLFRSKYDEQQGKFVDVNIKGQYFTQI